MKRKVLKMDKSVSEKKFGHILTHEETMYINDGRLRNNAVKAFKSKPYGMKNGGRDNGKIVKRGNC